MNWLTEYIEHPFLLFLSICIAVPILMNYVGWLFGGSRGLAEDLKVAALPDWYAFLKGRYWESEWAELKIGAFVLLCFGFVAALYKIGVKIFF